MKSLISIERHPTKPDANLLSTPGAFCWWYLDLVDEAGSGVVLIWSFGLPFLPDRAADDVPRTRPSLCLAVYEGGRQRFYLLQEYAPDEGAWHDGRWRMGRSHIRRVQLDGRQQWNVHLDLAIPGSDRRACGEIQVVGPELRLAKVAPNAADSASDALHADAGDHSWSPLATACPGVAELDLGEGSPFTLVGRAYVDGNLGRRPLTTLGIRRWRWGRLALDGRELIYYQLEPREPEGVPRTLVVEVAGDGQAGVVDAELDWQRPATSKYGPRFHRRVRIVGEDIDVEVRQRALVDDGPFYLRFLTTAHAGDGELIGHGTSELVLPERIDVPWQRPFVRMRRHHRSQRNSMWLPLFSGARRDRVSRLLRHWQRPTVVEARS